MVLQSPLLWLQNTNTDVWEYLMIFLVKVRKNKVLEEMKEAWIKTYSSIENRTDFEKYYHSYQTVNIGRMVAKNIRKGYFIADRLYPLSACDNINVIKYFVYGFQFYTMGGFTDIVNNYIPNRVELFNASTVINILAVLARLNDFEFTILDDTTIPEVVKFLYERERLETDKYIYCSIKNEIVSLED